ncbi:hypothetical protein I2494_05510 [Budviciaceae bacterium BWR-B9]|uniref:DUF2946 domain-containing protein n=1 Tax=Limnobaculum allomyrinae TaxID=2791986 RepID=A0ABS1IN38_9GAMM|nr:MULTISPECIES: hypothetical protein [Limnobaculum]MBK5143175.1 hypothetical protein [Limnobaculum allomyrinae]MBV7691063.1 hypothetical protein [Limnobaculum sp. M2-1]
MKLSLLPKLLLILAVLFSAPGFAMAANHDACAPVSVTQEHHTSMSQHDAPMDHCNDNAHCMLCFSVVPSISLSVATSVGHETYRFSAVSWHSRSLQPEPYPPRNLSV